MLVAIHIYGILFTFPDLLVIGVGEKENLQFFTSETMKFLRMNRVNIEVLPTVSILTVSNSLQ